MSSSGLIYAVIVGAWAAYLVPMWLRRQDELNEARPTERFSTAIRLLSGRAGMERRYAKAVGNSESNDDQRDPRDQRDGHDDRSVDSTDGDRAESDSARSAPTADGVDVRALAVPAKARKPKTKRRTPAPSAPPAPSSASGARNRRAKVLARRRRTTTVLFLAFTAGTIAAAVGGLAFLWAPAVPGGLLTLYIDHLRRQERRRFEVKLDRRRQAEAAKRVREQRAAAVAAAQRPAPPAPEPTPHEEARAVLEETDHAEWVDGLQRGTAADQDRWDPVPVPLPTYVTAPVAPRTPGGGPQAPKPSRAPAEDSVRQQSRGRARRARERGNTPLFDQYDAGDRPRAANE